MEKDNYQELTQKIDRIEREIKKQNSLRRIIPRAILNGIFASFGATIIFAIILLVLSQLIKSADQIPFLNDVIERTKLEEIIDNQQGRSITNQWDR